MENEVFEVLETHGYIAVRAVILNNKVDRYQIIDLRTKKELAKNDEFLNIQDIFLGMIASGEYDDR